MGAEPELILYGRQVPGLLQHNYGVQPRADGRVGWKLLYCALPTWWRQSPSHRGLLLQKEGGVRMLFGKLGTRAERLFCSAHINAMPLQVVQSRKAKSDYNMDRRGYAQVV